MCLVMVDALCYGLSDGNEEKGSLETLLKLTGINLVEDHIVSTTAATSHVRVNMAK